MFLGEVAQREGVDAARRSFIAAAPFGVILAAAGLAEASTPSPCAIRSLQDVPPASFSHLARHSCLAQFRQNMVHTNKAPRVFISYARKDGEEFARKLRERIENEEPEITLWQDRIKLEAGTGWWTQITEALDVVQFMVLVITPAVVESTVIRKEWRYARQQGVCVYPVKGVPDAEIDFAGLPRWMSKTHFCDLEHEWETFVNYLKSPCQTARVPFMAPDLPGGFIERPVLFEQLLKSLLETGRRNLALTTALHGAGGLGKTTL